MTHRTTTLVLLLSTTLAARGASAQEPPQPAAARPEAARAEAPNPEAAPRPSARQEAGPMLRVQLVISRYQGDRKTASLPYVLTMPPSGEYTRLRMGVDTPVPMGPPRATSKPNEDGAPGPGPSFQYRNVGTNIDCRAREVAGRKYRLNVRVENSSGVMSDAGKTSEPTLAGVPMFRRFEVNAEPVLGDGESTQVIASTDPVTGEVVKIDVTLSVLK